MHGGTVSWEQAFTIVADRLKGPDAHGGVSRAAKTLLALNQVDGFDCMSCAWPDPGHRKTFEFCENGAKAVTWEATPVVIGSGFWRLGTACGEPIPYCPVSAHPLAAGPPSLPSSQSRDATSAALATAWVEEALERAPPWVPASRPAA